MLLLQWCSSVLLLLLLWAPLPQVAAEEMFHQLQKAYDILTEPATRQALLPAPQ